MRRVMHVACRRGFRLHAGQVGDPPGKGAKDAQPEIEIECGRQPLVERTDLVKDASAEKGAWLADETAALEGRQRCRRRQCRIAIEDAVRFVDVVGFAEHHHQ
jgi:hypothetical protein